MHASTIDVADLAWFAGWTIAVLVLFGFVLRLPLQTRLSRGFSLAYNAVVVLGISAVAVLANVALSLHDVHVDLTREAVFTPSREAIEVVDRLQRPVQLTYYYQGEDENGRRAAEIWQVMARRNPLLQVRTLDPDREPGLARDAGLKLYNTAVLEADGRRILVSSTDEIEIAIGLQRVLRERVITACFMEGHQEYPMQGLEFHTHFESVAGHNHGDSSSARIQSEGHGVGRLQRSLAGLGYDTRVITPALEGSISPTCSVVIAAGPRTTWLPDEARIVSAYLERGGSMLLMFDLGFELEPGLAELLGRLGMRMAQQVLRDPASHYGRDIETVAVTAYDPHPITRRVSMTLFPGVRPIEVIAPADGLRSTALVSSSQKSYAVAVSPVAQRLPGDAAGTMARPPSGVLHLNSAPAPVGEGATDEVPVDQAARSHPIVAISEGRLSATSEADLRVAVVGDADFASNSFLPFVANSDLALSLLRWLVREERDAAIASRIPAPSLIILTDTQSRWIFIMLELLLPALVLMVGASVWWRRR